MRLFGSDRITGMMETLGLDEDMPIERKMLSNAIETAQRRVESRNFQARKSVLEYDDVMNTQRALIYDQRRKVLDGEDITQNILTMISDEIESAVSAGFGELDHIKEQAQLAEILTPLEVLFLRKGEVKMPAPGFDRTVLTELLEEKARAAYALREAELGLATGSNTPRMRELERYIMLRVVDEFWMEHIDAMESLRDSVRLRAYAQTNPVDEYKRDGFDMFEAMVGGIKEEVVRRMYTVRIGKDETLKRRGVARNFMASAQNVGGDSSLKKQPAKKGVKIGRNDPCPCGKKRPNGLPMKYKDCCGRNV